MLYRRWERRNLRKYTLIGWPGHDLLRVALRASVDSDDGDAGAKVLDEMPTCASDGEEIAFVGGGVEDVDGGVVLEKEVPVHGDAANVLEHVGELHVLRIRPESVESVT